MSFASLHFILFFPIALCCYYCFRPRNRWLFLLLASIYFYAAFIPQYTLILFGLIVIDYIAALGIQTGTRSRKLLCLLASICSNIGILIFFKYFTLLTYVGWLPHIPFFPKLGILMPLGLSFHVFQSLSYVIEVYRGTYPAERHLGRYALYVLFFPQLVAGPIERPAHLLPQLKTAHAFDMERLKAGLTLMLWGFFKKIVVADRLAQFVDPVFGNPLHAHALTVILAILLFTFQLYADFSGYVDIARGAARIIGIDLAPNFNQPFLATSIADFWRRWHISLSTWFRDYVYIPLGGSRTTLWKWERNILITFILTGIWHGAGWNFVVMGLLSAGYIIAGRFITPLRSVVLQRMQTYVLMSLCWVFFRAPSFGYAITLLKGLGNWHGISKLALFSSYRPMEFVIALLGIISVLAIERYDLLHFHLHKTHPIFRSAATAFLILLLLVYGVFTNKSFIYFQF